MKRHLALVGAFGTMVALVGCGSGDPAVPKTGILHVTSGGNGGIYFPRSQSTLPFGDSVSVAVRSSNDASDVFTVFTFFGLDSLTLTQVPQAVLVTFIDVLSPTATSATDLPSSVLRMVLHTGFDLSLVTPPGEVPAIYAQDARMTYENAANGTFLLEQRITVGSYSAPTSTSRRARWDSTTIEDTASGDEALIDGSVDYTVSINVPQNFYGYAGNLGLLTPPPTSGGGPPPPPGSTGGGGAADTTEDSDSPPSPPL